MSFMLKKSQQIIIKYHYDFLDIKDLIYIYNVYKNLSNIYIYVRFNF